MAYCQPALLPSSPYSPALLCRPGPTVQIGWSVLGNVVLIHEASSHWSVVLVDVEAPTSIGSLLELVDV